jgi:hypothetical protein
MISLPTSLWNSVLEQRQPCEGRSLPRMRPGIRNRPATVTWRSKTFALGAALPSKPLGSYAKACGPEAGSYCGGIIQSIFAPEAATTFPILVHSVATIVPSCSRVMGEISMLNPRNASRISSASNSLCISTLSLLTISDGVFRGPNNAFQITISKSGTPASATVGRSGKAGERFKPVTASPRRLPFRTSSSTAVRDPK